MKTLIFCFVFTIGLIGCSPKNLSSERDVESTRQDIPILSSPSPSIIPTPIASKGTVVGTLINGIPGNSLAGLSLYFGTRLPLTPGPDHLVNLDLENSPKAIINENGSFMAENIIPGEYVLILWTPHDSRYIPDPNDPYQELIVGVLAGQIVDLGSLMVAPTP